MQTAHTALALSVATLLGVVVLVLRPAPEAAAPADYEALVGETKALREDVRRLAETVGKLESSRRAAPVPAVPQPSPAAGTTSGGTAGDPAALAESAASMAAERTVARIEARIDEQIAERNARIAGREYSEDGRWKAPIDELAKELALDDATKESVKRVFDGAKDRGYAILRLQRLDGGSPLDDYVSALRNSQDAEGSTRAFFQRIVNERIPGTDQTYLAGLLEVGLDTDRELAGVLDARAMRTFRGLRVDLLDVKTGYDPIGDYVRARLQ